MLLHLATRTNDQIYRWTIQKHLKSPKCKFFEKTENIKHLYTDCKRNKNLNSLPKILQKSNAKRIYAITTYPNYISLIIIPKNKETFTNTNHNNTHTYLENKKPTKIRRHYNTHNKHNY